MGTLKICILATAAFLIATSEAKAGSNSHSTCQGMVEHMRAELNACEFHAQNSTFDDRELHWNQCKQARREANQMIQWCNRNINSCPTKRVSWYIDIPSASSKSWRNGFRIECS